MNCIKAIRKQIVGFRPHVAGQIVQRLHHWRNWRRKPRRLFLTFFIDKTHNEVPLPLRHLRNAKSTLAERLHVLQTTTILGIYLQLLELDESLELVSKANAHFTPFWIL